MSSSFGSVSSNLTGVASFFLVGFGRVVVRGFLVDGSTEERAATNLKP